MEVPLRPCALNSSLAASSRRERMLWPALRVARALWRGVGTQSCAGANPCGRRRRACCFHRLRPWSSERLRLRPSPPSCLYTIQLEPIQTLFRPARAGSLADRNGRERCRAAAKNRHRIQEPQTRGRAHPTRRPHRPRYANSSRSRILRALVKSSSHQGFSPAFRGGRASCSFFLAFLACCCATRK